MLPVPDRRHGMNSFAGRASCVYLAQCWSMLSQDEAHLSRMRAGRFLRCVELRQVRVDVGSERWVLAQSREMAHGPRELGVDLRSENRIEALLFERPRPRLRLLVEEETHLGDEADVREGDVASHQEPAVG